MGDERLAARVRAVNKVHERVNTLYAELEPIYQQFINCKIYKKACSFLKSVEAKLPKYSWEDHISVSRSDYSIYYRVYHNETYGKDNWGSDKHISYEATVYIGSVGDGVLLEIPAHTPRRTDYVASDIEAARVAYRDAQKIADNLKSALEPFGDYDR
jgi:hypothetical protein